MSRVLNMHPEIVSFGESAFWGRGYVEPETEAGYTRQQLDTLAVHCEERSWGPHSKKEGSLKSVNEDGYGGFAPTAIAESIRELNEPATPKQVFDEICKGFMEGDSKQYPVEKTPHHMNWVDRILDVYPDAKFIVMLRPAYDFMFSYKYQGAQKSVENRGVFKKLYHPLVCSLVWRGYIRSYFSLKEKRADHCVFIWTDELKSDEKGALERVQEFLEVEQADIAGQVLKANSSFSKNVLNEKREMTAADYFWMNLLCKKYIKRCGHEIKRTPLGLFSVGKSFVVMPFWLVRNRSVLKKVSQGSFFRYVKHWIVGR